MNRSDKHTALLQLAKQRQADRLSGYLKGGRACPLGKFVKSCRKSMAANVKARLAYPAMQRFVFPQLYLPLVGSMPPRESRPKCLVVPTTLQRGLLHR